MTKEIIDQSYEIMENFDFAKVHDYMVAKDWKWAHSDGSYRTPTIEELKSTADMLLNKLVWVGDTSYVATGGFHAIKFDWGMKLFFAIENY